MFRRFGLQLPPDSGLRPDLAARASAFPPEAVPLAAPAPAPAPTPALVATSPQMQPCTDACQSEAAEDRVFLHRGIAARAFQRSFVLADGVEVSGARLENGLLHVELNRAVPETIVKTIRIGGSRA